jgi:hypothetical protein
LSYGPMVLVCVVLANDCHQFAHFDEHACMLRTKVQYD